MTAARMSEGEGKRSRNRPDGGDQEAQLLQALRSKRTLDGESPESDSSRPGLSDLERLREVGLLAAGSHGLPAERCQLLMLSFDSTSDRQTGLDWLAHQLPSASVYRMAGAFGFDALVCGPIDQRWVKDKISQNLTGIPSFSYYNKLNRIFRYKGYQIEGLSSTDVEPVHFEGSGDLAEYVVATRTAPHDRQWLHNGLSIGAYTFFVMLRSRIDIQIASEWLETLGLRYPQMIPYVHDAFSAVTPQPNDYRTQPADRRIAEMPRAIYKADYLLRLQLISVENGEFGFESPFAQADRIREFLALSEENHVIEESELLFLEAYSESHEQPNSAGIGQGGVFVSYSHKDSRWLDLIRTHLQPYVRSELLEVWDASENRVGDQWREELNVALASARVAVLLVSGAFLQSEFIAREELGIILERQRSGSLRIVWVPVSASSYEVTELEAYQAAIDPKRPLDSFSEAEQQSKAVDICKEIFRQYDQL